MLRHLVYWIAGLIALSSVACIDASLDDEPAELVLGGTSASFPGIDFDPPFPPSPPSCEGQCGGVGMPVRSGQDPCSCLAGCEADGTCCADLATACPPAGDSCEGACGGRAASGCWCDDACQAYGDCCADVAAACQPFAMVSRGSESAIAGAADADGEHVVIGGVFEGDLDLGGTEIHGTPGNIAQDGFVARYRAAGDLSWVHVFGGLEQTWVHDVALDGQGLVYVAGQFRGTVDFGDGVSRTSAGHSDGFVMCLSTGGRVRWVRTFGGAGEDAAYSLVAGDRQWAFVAGRITGAVDVGTGALSGGRFFLAAYDLNGRPRWSRAVETGGLRAPALALSGPFEDLLVSTSFTRTRDIGGGPVTSAGGRDVLVARFDHLGRAIVPTFSFGSAGHDSVDGLAGDAWGNVHVSGVFERPLTLGDTVLTPTAARNTFLASFHYDGGARWARLIEGADSPPESAGRTNARVSADSGGNVWLATSFRSAMDLGGATLVPNERDAAMASYTTAGTLRFYTRVGGRQSEFVTDVVADDHGRGFLLGYSYGTTEIDGRDPVTAALSDIFLVRDP